MAAQAYEIVESLLYGRTKTLGGSPTIAWPGRLFEPSIDQVYLDVDRPLFTEPSPSELGMSSRLILNGIFQITVVYPLISSWAGAAQLESDIVSHFARGLELEGSGLKVRILRTWPGPLIKVEDTWNRRPVSTRFVCFAQI